jgi:uracil-DNA glycosylase
MPSQYQIESFVRSLKTYPSSLDVNNFYESALFRRQNLKRYLLQMASLAPHTLLVGEAPGYNGCAQTGIPFSSEKLLREGVAAGRVFGRENGYRVNDKNVIHEQTAQTIWEFFESYEPLPLFWNAFAFHPHEANNPNSNRKPRVGEIESTLIYLTRLIDLYNIQTVIAVGNSADLALQRCKIEHFKVRHPSYGGKKIFISTLQSILS